MTPEEHRGINGPHRDKKTDLMYKEEMQDKLEEILDKEIYNVKELVDILGLREEQANKALRKIQKVDGISREDVIRRLMGGKLYKELE